MTPALLSVIIPTLNEAEHLPALLADLRRQQGVNLEILIADGGSTDATRAVAEASGGAFIAARRGRGAQMNAAVQAAAGDTLLFLHADSRLDDPGLLCLALAALAAASAEGEQVAGHFPLRFLRTTRHNALAYRYLEAKSALNRLNTANGDQGLLLSREFFCQLGGFAESLPFLEDQGLAAKIRAQGRWITLPGTLQTSARRFEREGFHRRYILMSMMMGFYSIGEKDFLVRAPGIYRLQGEAGELCLSPFFRLIHTLLAEWGIGGSLRIFYRLGGYLRQHSWQPFFFLDVCLQPWLGAGRYPFLALHDRVVAPVTDFKLFDAAAGLLGFFWYIGILAPFFRLIEGSSAPPSSGHTGQ